MQLRRHPRGSWLCPPSAESRPSREGTPHLPSQLAHDRSGPRGQVPVVLIHAGVADRRMWDPQRAALTHHHDVVRLDLRGFGESTERPEDGWSYTADVAATLASLGVDRAHLVGCSMGAGVAVELALMVPGLAASLLLVAPGGALITEATGLASISAVTVGSDRRSDLPMTAS